MFDAAQLYRKRKQAGCSNRLAFSGAAFWLWGLLSGELILAHGAQGAGEVFRDILPLGAGGNAAFGVAGRFVIFPAANVAYIFHSKFLLDGFFL